MVLFIQFFLKVYFRRDQRKSCKADLAMLMTNQANEVNTISDKKVK